MQKTKSVFVKANILPFVNREQELSYFEDLYTKTESQAQFLVLYGKRRVGKTELIKQFFKDKPSLYYLASKGSARDQLRTATEIITRHFSEEFLGRDAFTEWRTLFDYLGKKLKDTGERLVLVFDEFPYLVESDKAISSYFQYGWDEKLKDTNVMLVLMGSSIAMMYKHALNHSSPLYARRTSQWLLEPFTFEQSKNFFDSDDFERVFSLYALAGGIPAYLKEFDVQKTILENIEEKVLTKGSFLYLEPELLLSDEFKEPRKYLTILKAVGLGRTKYSELLNSTGFANNILSSYLSTLIDLKIVKREVPVTEKSPKKSKKGSYSLADSFLRFYFSFVFPDLSLVESGETKALFKKNKEILVQLIAKAYEDATAEFIKTATKKNALPHFEQMGRWWDKNTEIDLVALNSEENSILFVETKWNEKPLDSRVLHSLKTKAQKVKWGRKGRKEHFALVARGGFDEKLIKDAEKQNITLIKEDE